MHDLGIRITWVHVSQASHCHTQTMTDGNTLHSLISFVLQHIASTRSYKVMYMQRKNNDMKK